MEFKYLFSFQVPTRAEEAARDYARPAASAIFREPSRILNLTEKARVSRNEQGPVIGFVTANQIVLRR